MKDRLGLHDPAVVAANERVRVNIECLMEMHRLTQAELAERIGKSQPWLSKRMTGTTPFQIEDLDSLSYAFGLSPAQLLQEGYGKLDRRVCAERRSGMERRQLGERFQSPRGAHRLRTASHDGDGKPESDDGNSGPARRVS